MKKKNDDIIIGFHGVMEAINAGKNFEKIFIKKGLRGDLFQECFKLIRQSDIPFQYVPIEKLNRITRANHQGIIAQITPIEYSDLTMLLPTIYENGKDPFILLLDGITDVRNFGAIARSAEAAGVDAIVIGTKNSVIINSDAIKTSAGALTRISVCRVKSIPNTIRYLKESGITTFGASEKSNQFHFNTNYTTPIAIVMGAEDKGLSIDSLKQIDQLVKIPMMGHISSLNVSVACGILMFEAVRQRSLQ